MSQLLPVIIYLAFISLGLPGVLLGSAWLSMYRELGALVSHAGIISMITAGGIIVSSLFSNRLIRAFGTGKVIVISVAMTAVALFGFSFSHSLIRLCLWVIPYSLEVGSVGVKLSNFVVLHYKSRHVGWLHYFWGIGATAGPYIMGLCLTRGFRWSSGYMVVGVIQTALVVYLVPSLPLWRVRTEGSSGQDDTHKQITPREGLRLPGVKAVLTAFSCYCALEATAGLWVSSYMVLHKGIVPQTTAKQASFLYLGITLGRLVNGFVTDRAGDRNMAHCGQLIIFAGIVLLSLPVDDRAILAGLIMVGLGCVPIYPSLFHETPDNFGMQHSQSMMGMQMACAYVGSTFMPLLPGAVAERISVTLYPVCLVVFVVLMTGMAERIGGSRMGKLMDLHMHSYCSGDGEFSPGELVRQCGMNGIRIMSIADHNSVRASEAGRQAALRAGITYVSGIEIDCTFRGVNLHVLGYGIDDTGHDFTCIEDNTRSQAAAVFSQMLCATREMGSEVTAEDMAGLAGEHYWKDRWTGEMFAEVLLGREEYKDHPLLLPYRAGGARSDNPLASFYWDFYSQGKCCYVKMEYPQLEEVVDTTHRNEGYAVLAHPGVNLKDRTELLDSILEAGVDGIEASSSYHSQEQATFYYKAVCGRFRMVICGSDYHGKIKPSISIGGHGRTAPYEETIRQLGHIPGDMERKERSRGTRMKVSEMNGRWT